MNRNLLSVGAIAAILVVGAVAFAQNKPEKPKSDKPEKPAAKQEESERKVKESEVPKAALEALKAQAGTNALTEFSEEIEHGHKFYEGTYKTAGGSVDVLVTEDGALVEIEETVAADKVPAGVRGEIEKAAGKDNAAKYEKKTMILYEAHFKKDGKGHEIVVTPDGRRFHEEGEGEGDKDDDDD